MSSQKLILKKFADENGFTNTAYYVDDGVSGTTFERDGFKTMMADIEDGKVGTVITKDYCEIMGLNQKDLENKAFWLSPFFF